MYKKLFWTVIEWSRLNLKQITHVARGFIYKCVQVDVYPPLSPLLINMTRENLLGVQISES